VKKIGIKLANKAPEMHLEQRPVEIIAAIECPNQQGAVCCT